MQEESQLKSTITKGAAISGDAAIISDPSDFTPLYRFAEEPERHERIAVSLALNTRCEVPYKDFLPCPGSGPGSPIASNMTEHSPAITVSANQPPSQQTEILQSQSFPIRHLEHPSDTDPAGQWLHFILRKPPN